ncbi:hypothetical protein GCM10009808_15560 [Microbacterium sediminicola]|uniref:Uncharacterized protein n=1 Tax=Microbacterium sediminicola TaxID=415210 RepID=A0ABP4U5U3_9MICO
MVCEHSAGVVLPSGRFLCFGCDEFPRSAIENATQSAARERMPASVRQMGAISDLSRRLYGRKELRS